MNTEVGQLIREAQSLLARIKEGSIPAVSATADDLLLFCYRLRDGYRIVGSSSKQFRGPTFSSLNGLLYELESKPDETMQSIESVNIESSDLLLRRVAARIEMLDE